MSFIDSYVEELTGTSASKADLIWAKLNFTAGARRRLYRKLAVMLQRLAVLDAIQELLEIESREFKQMNAPMAIVLTSIAYRVSGGDSLSKALEGWVPDVERMLLSAADSAGELDKRLLDVILLMDARSAVRKAIGKAFAYPLVLMSMATAILVIFCEKAVPGFTRLLPPDQWTGLGRLLYFVSLAVTNFGAIALVTLIVATFFAFRSLATWNGPVRKYAEYLPPWSLYKMEQGVGFLLAIAALSKGGVPILTALEQVSEISKPWMQERVEKAMFWVRDGANLGQALDKTGYEFPNKEAISDFKIYAKYAGFAAQAETVAKEWLEDGVKKIQKTTSVLGGLGLAAVVCTYLLVNAGQQSIVGQVNAANQMRMYR